MTFETWADIILVFHFGYVCFVLIGQLLIVAGCLLRWQWVRNIWFRAAHLSAIALVVVRALLLDCCPLTDWEFDLRRLDHNSWEAATPAMRFLQTCIGYRLEVSPTVFLWLYVCFAALVLATLLLAPPRRRVHI